MTSMNHCIFHYIISTLATFPAHHILLHLTILTSDTHTRHTVAHSALSQTAPLYLTILTSDDPHTHTRHTVAHSALSQTAPLYNHSRYTHFPLHLIFTLFVIWCLPASLFTPTHTHTQQLAVLISKLSPFCVITASDLNLVIHNAVFYIDNVYFGRWLSTSARNTETPS
jgi:hypothetical protein